MADILWGRKFATVAAKSSEKRPIESKSNSEYVNGVYRDASQFGASLARRMGYYYEYCVVKAATKQSKKSLIAGDTNYAKGVELLELNKNIRIQGKRDSIMKKEELNAIRDDIRRAAEQQVVDLKKMVEAYLTQEIKNTLTGKRLFFGTKGVINNASISFSGGSSHGDLAIMDKNGKVIYILEFKSQRGDTDSARSTYGIRWFGLKDSELFAGDPFANFLAGQSGQFLAHNVDAKSWYSDTIRGVANPKSAFGKFLSSKFGLTHGDSTGVAKFLNKLMHKGAVHESSTKYVPKKVLYISGAGHKGGPITAMVDVDEISKRFKKLADSEEVKAHFNPKAVVFKRRKENMAKFYINSLGSDKSNYEEQLKAHKRNELNVTFAFYVSNKMVHNEFLKGE